MQAWGKLGETVSTYCAKGKEIVVWGEMQSRHYEAKDGSKRVAWSIRADSIDFCGSKSDSPQQSRPAPQSNEPIPSSFNGAEPEDPDALPF